MNYVRVSIDEVKRLNVPFTCHSETFSPGSFPLRVTNLESFININHKYQVPFKFSNYDKYVFYVDAISLTKIGKYL